MFSRYLETHLGGEEVCQDTFDVIFEYREHSPTLVRATVSVWDGDDAFEHEMQVLVSIPKNSEKEDPRAYAIQSDRLAPPDSFLGCYLGLPMPPEQTEQGSWWGAKAYPTLADEGKNLIYLTSDNNHIPEKEHLSLIIGSPWNTTEICKTLCQSICSKSEKIIKVDVSENETDIARTVSLWSAALPLALEIITLRQKNHSEYNVQMLQNLNGTPITDSMNLDMPPRLTRHQDKKYYSEILNNSTFYKLIDSFIIEQRYLITSGFRMRYLRWFNVYHGDNLPTEKRFLAMYSKTQVDVTQTSKPRVYVGRIGRAKRSPVTLSLAMANFGAIASQNALSTCIGSDGIWVLAENLVDDYNPIPGPLDNTEQLNVEQVLFKHLFTEYSWNKADFTKE